MEAREEKGKERWGIVDYENQREISRGKGQRVRGREGGASARE